MSLLSSISIISSAVVLRLTAGPSQFAPADACRSHSDRRQQGGRHRRRGGGRGRGDSMSHDGAKGLLVGKTKDNESSSLGYHAKQKSSEKSTSH